MKVKFLGLKASLIFNPYKNGNIGISLFHKKHGYVAHLDVASPEVLPKHHIRLKTQEIFAPVFQTLREQGWIKEVLNTGYDGVAYCILDITEEEHNGRIHWVLGKVK